MKRFETTILPINLQYFAEPDTNPKAPDSGDEPNDGPQGGDGGSSEGSEKPDKSEDDAKNVAIIEKLKGRIGQEQGNKNALQEQLNKAQEELAKLRKGKHDKKPMEQIPEQKKVAELEAKLARRDTINETVSIFNESGVNISKDIVEVLVTDDHDQMIDNASKLLKFVVSIQKDTETNIRKEYQAGKIPSDTKHKAESLSDFGESIAESN